MATRYLHSQGSHVPSPCSLQAYGSMRVTFPMNIPIQQLDIPTHTGESPASPESKRGRVCGFFWPVLLQGPASRISTAPFYPALLVWPPSLSLHTFPSGHCLFSLIPLTKLLHVYVFTDMGGRPCITHLWHKI